MTPYVVCICVGLGVVGIVVGQRPPFDFCPENPSGSHTSATARDLPQNCQQYGSMIYCKNPIFAAIPQTFPLGTTCLVIESGALDDVLASDIAYLTHLKTFAILKTRVNVLSGEFGHQPSLENLVFRETGLTALPSVVGNVKTLEISSAKVSVLNAATLVESSLETLNVSTNHLTSLDAKLLAHLPTTLQTLDLSGSPIKTINAASFPDLPNLRTLRIGAENVDSRGFRGLNNVENIITNTCHISSYAFQDLKKVSDMDLSRSCKIGSQSLNLGRYAFSGMEGLLTLNLDNSGIRQIPTKAFSGLPNIQSISVRYNPLRSIMQGAFDGLTSLREILLSHVLKERSESNMVLMGDNTFSYAHLPSLTVLDISSLILWNITTPTFRNLPSLEEVYFNSNLLHFLQNGTLSNLPELRKVRMADNPWGCDCTLRWLREMMDNRPELFDDGPEVTCAAPPDLAGRRFVDLTPEDFRCSHSVFVGR